MKNESLFQKNNESILQRYGAILFFCIILIANIFVTPNFFHINTLWNAVLQSTTVMLLSLGMMLIIATGGIDISVGSTVAFSSCILVLLWHAGYGILSIFAAVIACGVLGAFSGFIIYRFKIQPLIVTLGLMTSVRGAAQLLTSGQMIQLRGKELLDFGYYRVFGAIPIQLFIILFFVLIFFIIVKKTRLGIYIESYGDNANATRLAGVSTGVLLISVYMIGGLMCGVGGILETMRLCAADPNYTGLNMEMDAIAAVAIGGTPLTGGKIHVLGTVVGVFLMQMINMMVNMNNIQFQASLIIKAFIIVIALYFGSTKRNKKKLVVNRSV